MGGGNVMGVLAVELVEVDESPFLVGVLRFRFVEKPLLFDVPGNFGVGEEATEVGIGEGVVVGEGDFVYVVAVDKFLFWRVLLVTEASAHDQ